MANLRNDIVIHELRSITSGIKDLSVKFGNLLEDNMDLFSKDDLLEHLEVIQDNIEKLTDLSDKKDSPFVSDDEIVNDYYDLYELINNEYLALKADILKRKINKKQ